MDRWVNSKLNPLTTMNANHNPAVEQDSVGLMSGQGFTRLKYHHGVMVMVFDVSLVATNVPELKCWGTLNIRWFYLSHKLTDSVECSLRLEKCKNGHLWRNNNHKALEHPQRQGFEWRYHIINKNKTVWNIYFWTLLFLFVTLPKSSAPPLAIP